MFRAMSAPHQAWAVDQLAAALERIAPVARQRRAGVKPRLERVLEAFRAERLGVHHFASVSGYGHGDLGREVLDRVFAEVLQAEAAAVRLQFEWHPCHRGGALWGAAPG